MLAGVLPSSEAYVPVAEDKPYHTLRAPTLAIFHTCAASPSVSTAAQRSGKALRRISFFLQSMEASTICCQTKPRPEPRSTSVVPIFAYVHWSRVCFGRYKSSSISQRDTPHGRPASGLRDEAACSEHMHDRKCKPAQVASPTVKRKHITIDVRQSREILNNFLCCD